MSAKNISMKNQKKIPTLLGISIIGLALVVLSVIYNTIFQQQSRAEALAPPKNVQFSNIQTSSLTVTWMTAIPASDSIETTFPSGKKFVYFSDAESNKSNKKKIYHSITLTSLSPQTHYPITIYSNGKAYPLHKNEKGVSTAPDIGKNKLTIPPAHGKILGKDNTPIVGALILLNTTGAQLMSTTTNAQGEWLIALSMLRSEDLSAYKVLNESTVQSVTAYHANDLAFAKIDMHSSTPVQTMTIGQTYDFRTQKKSSIAQLPITEAQTVQNVLGEQTGNIQKKDYLITITQPVDGASLVSNVPLFQGTGIPGTSVTLIIGITHPKTHSVVVNSDGIWRFTPLEPLGIGKQSITVTSTDKAKNPVAITNTFDVLKSGTQVLGIATPSATITTSPPPATPTTSIGVLPSVTITVTPTPTIALLDTPTPTSNEPPVSGSAFPTLVLIMGSVALVSFGIFGLTKST